MPVIGIAEDSSALILPDGQRVTPTILSRGCRGLIKAITEELGAWFTPGAVEQWIQEQEGPIHQRPIRYDEKSNRMAGYYAGVEERNDVERLQLKFMTPLVVERKGLHSPSLEVSLLMCSAFLRRGRSIRPGTIYEQFPRLAQQFFKLENVGVRLMRHLCKCLLRWRVLLLSPSEAIVHDPSDEAELEDQEGSDAEYHLEEEAGAVIAGHSTHIARIYGESSRDLGMTSAILMRRVLQLCSAWQTFLGLKPASPSYRQQLAIAKQQSVAPVVDALVAKLGPQLRRRGEEITASLRRALQEFRMSEPLLRGPSYPFDRSAAEETTMSASASGEAWSSRGRRGGETSSPRLEERFVSEGARSEAPSAFQRSRSGRGSGGHPLDVSGGSGRLRESPQDAQVVEWAKTALSLCKPHCPLCLVLKPGGSNVTHECTPTKCPEASRRQCCCHCFLTGHQTSYCPSNRPMGAVDGDSGPRCTSCTLGHHESHYLHLCAGGSGKRCSSMGKKVILPMAWAVYHHATEHLSRLLLEAELVGDWSELAPLQPDKENHRRLFVRWLLRPATSSATVSNAMMVCIWWTFKHNHNVADRSDAIKYVLRQASKW